MRKWAWLLIVGYIGTIFAANWAIVTFGVIPVGIGLMAPAGVLFAGLAFTFRDLVQEQFGRTVTLYAIAGGALCSALISPQLALASGMAFLLSELADFAVYTPLRSKNFLTAVLVSNLVGTVVDSVLFLLLAFGSLDYLLGQVVGKWEMTVLTVGLLSVRRVQVLFRHAFN